MVIHAGGSRCMSMVISSICDFVSLYVSALWKKSDISYQHQTWYTLTLWQDLSMHRKIKTDRPLTRDTLNAPWLLTDSSNGLVMVICNYHWLNSASRVLISSSSAPLVRTGEHTQFLLFDLDLQSQDSQGQSRPSFPKLRSNGSNRRVPTDKRTHAHGRYQTYCLPCYVVDNQGHRVMHGVMLE